MLLADEFAMFCTGGLTIEAVITQAMAAGEPVTDIL